MRQRCGSDAEELRNKARGCRFAAIELTEGEFLASSATSKASLQKGVRATVRCGLGLPARKRVLFDRGKTADYAAAEPENCADGNHAFGGKGWPQQGHSPAAFRSARSFLMRSAPVWALPVVGRPGGRLRRSDVSLAACVLSFAMPNNLQSSALELLSAHWLALSLPRHRNLGRFSQPTYSSALASSSSRRFE